MKGQLFLNLRLAARRVFFMWGVFLIWALLLNGGNVFALPNEDLRGVSFFYVPERLTLTFQSEQEQEEYSYTLQELSLVIQGDGPAGKMMSCQDKVNLRSQLVKLAEIFDRPPADARLSWDENNEIIIVPEQEGRSLEVDSLFLCLANPGFYQERYALPVKKVRPEVTAEELREKLPRKLWAQYSTQLTDIPDRTENVRLASYYLNGLIVEPGEEISFNETVGAREKERGFREAKVIVGGRFENGLGGGVCQVSSTFYNALLLSGLQITERHNHSVRIAYVPLGRDATVVYGQKDLQFKNNTDSYLQIRTKLEDLCLTIAVYGAGECPFQGINLYNKIIKMYPAAQIIKTDPSFPGKYKIAEKGQNGYLVEMYRQIDSGGEKKTEKLSRDYYAPVDAVLIRNE